MVLSVGELLYMTPILVPVIRVSELGEWVTVQTYRPFLVPGVDDALRYIRLTEDTPVHGPYVTPCAVTSPGTSWSSPSVTTT